MACSSVAVRLSRFFKVYMWLGQISTASKNAFRACSRSWGGRGGGGGWSKYLDQLISGKRNNEE